MERQVSKMRFFTMFVTAVCFMFLIIIVIEISLDNKKQADVIKYVALVRFYLVSVQCALDPESSALIIRPQRFPNLTSNQYSHMDATTRNKTEKHLWSELCHQQ